MIDDKFIEYFNNPENSFGEKDCYGNIRYMEPTFLEFADIIHGLGSGNSFNLYDFQYSKLPAFKTYLAYSHFVITSPVKKHENYLASLILPTHKTPPEDMTAEQLAARIIYWFWRRICPNVEIEMAQNGKMGKYLKLLKEKSLQTDK